MAKGALSRHQVMNIMSNELIRRLEVTSDDADIKENYRIIEQYTQQLTNSEYNWKLCGEIIVSGPKNWKRKEARKWKLKVPRFRCCQLRLKTRSDKKLIQKYNWFKQKQKDMDEDIDNENKSDDKMKSVKWEHYKFWKSRSPQKAVLFVPYMVNGELASENRKIIQDLRPKTQMN